MWLTSANRRTFLERGDQTVMSYICTLTVLSHTVILHMQVLPILVHVLYYIQGRMKIKIIMNETNLKVILAEIGYLDFARPDITRNENLRCALEK